MPGMNQQDDPEKDPQRTLINVLKNGRQRLRKTDKRLAQLHRSQRRCCELRDDDRSHARDHAGGNRVATNFNRLRIPMRREHHDLLKRVLPGGQYLYQRNALISRMLVIIIGTCAIKLSLRNFGKYSL